MHKIVLRHSLWLWPLAFALLLLLSPHAQAQSPLGNALSFNGSNQYVTVPNFGNIIPTNEITVEFWANTAGFATQSAFMLNPDQSTNRLNAHLDYGTNYNNALTYWDFGNISVEGRVFAASPLNSISNWVHYALVASQSSNYMRIYTNGVLQTSQSGMSPFIRGSYSLQIGGPGFPYKGVLDELRVWSVARSQAQIQSDLYTPLAGNEPNLVVYYKFDSSSGNVLINSATATGAAYNGILTNSPAWVSSTIPIPTTVVTSLADSGPGTLRQAVSNAVPGNLITFAANLAGKMVLLTNGLIDISNNVVIDASALPGGIQLNGNNQSRLFLVGTGTHALMNSLTVMNGYATGDGGGILNYGTLTMNNCLIRDNNGPDSQGGGGIYNISGSTLVVNNCAFTDNQANNCLNGGGAISAENSTTVTVNNSTFVGNQANGSGGGAIESEGTMAVNNSTFTGNQANNALGGGAILSFLGTLTVINCTFAGNEAIGSSSGGGIMSLVGTLNLTNCIVCSNIAPSSTNISGAYAGANNLVDTNALLAPLGNYGGTTMTMPPLTGSPAIDAGNDSVTALFATDQRGSARKVGAHVDIGAVESGGLWVVNGNDTGSGSLRYVLTNAAATVASPKIINFDPSMSGESVILASQLLVTDSYGVTMDASSLPAGIQINGDATTRVFYVTNGAVATFKSLTIDYGLAPGGDFASGGGGGGIFCQGQAILLDCSILNNLVVAPETNFGFAAGVAVYGGNVAMTNCTVANNEVFGPAGNSGAFFNYQGTLVLDHCTVANNLADTVNGGSTQSGTASLHASVLANGNTDFYNYGGGVSLGDNFVSDGTSSGLTNGFNGDQIGTAGNPLAANLAELGNYGGPTPTMPPLPGSPVVDMGGPPDTATDQRGYPRVAGFATDVGAVEGVYLNGNLGKLTNVTALAGGAIQFSFNAQTDANIQVWAGTNIAQPLSTWTPIGWATENPTGHYQFIDWQAGGNYPERFYRAMSP